MPNVNITQTAIDCAIDIESFNTSRLGQIAAQELAESLIDDAQEHLSHDPMRFRVCPATADFGVVIRERIDSRGFRTLFEVTEGTEDTEGTVEVLLILHQRQNIQDALSRHLLAYKN